MPRKPRFFLPNIPVHAVVRGNSRNNIFFDDSDRARYLDLAKEASQKCSVSVYAYVLMDNHVHWLINSDMPESISKFMQYIGRKYVPYFNRKYNRSGTLWEGRFKASLVDSEGYLLNCYRYIELNPVRAGMVVSPVEYPWSSYHANALGKSDVLLRPHDVYLGLAMDSFERYRVYQAFVSQKNDEGSIETIRSALQTGTPLGGSEFKSKVEGLIGASVGYTQRGRPPRS